MDTLVIEVPLYVFQQTLIEPMFVLFGNKLLENLCDKVPVQSGAQFGIDPAATLFNGAQQNGQQSPYIDFPSIEDTMTVYSRLK